MSDQPKVGVYFYGDNQLGPPTTWDAISQNILFLSNYTVALVNLDSQPIVGYNINLQFPGVALCNIKNPTASSPLTIRFTFLDVNGRMTLPPVDLPLTNTVTPISVPIKPNEGIVFDLTNVLDVLTTGDTNCTLFSFSTDKYQLPACTDTCDNKLCGQTNACGEACTNCADPTQVCNQALGTCTSCSCKGSKCGDADSCGNTCSDCTVCSCDDDQECKDGSCVSKGSGGGGGGGGSEKKSMVVPIIIIVVVLLLLLAGGAYYAYTQGMFN